MDVDQVSVHYIAEVTRGTTPTSPAFKQLRVAVPELNTSVRTIQSRELTGDRQLRELIDVGQDVSGSMGLEFVFDNGFDILEAAMCGTWASKANLVPTAFATTSITVASGGTAFKKGMLVRGSGNAQAANNALFKLGADGGATSITITGGAVETPPAGALIRAVGFECAVGDCQASIVSSKARLTITSTSGVWNTLGLAVGEWVLIGGSADANKFAANSGGCNGWARIYAIAATTLDFDIYPSGFGTDAGSGKTIRIGFGDRLINGVVRRSFTVQRRFNDHSPVEYETTRGQEVATYGLSMRPEEILNASCSFMGDTGEITQSQISGATDLPAATGDVLATQDVDSLLVDGVISGAGDGNYIQSLQINIDNQMRPRRGVGHRGYVGRGLGKFIASGQIETYFATYALAQKANNNLDVGIAGGATDNLGRSFRFDVPAARLSGVISTPGTGQDAMFRGTMTGRKHPTLLYTLLYQRYWETV